ncbi:hypothetical protein [Thermocrinis sp.]
MVDKRAELSKEVIDTLISIARKVMGDNAVDGILRMVSQKKNNEWTGVDVIFAFADEIQNLFGENGGHAIMRQVGREVAKALMASKPREEWEDVFENALNILGFADRVVKGQGCAEICNCVFYDSVLKERNLKPIEHSVCWAGLGFIEAFVKDSDKARGIRWVSRDYEKKRCKFDFLY